MFQTLLTLIFLTLCGIATAEPTPRWVVGSYVNVRVQPSRTAAVVAHVTANTPVKLLTQVADYCEISFENNQQGFVACNLLGEQALRIEDIGVKNPPTVPPHPHYSPLRAFWIEPTIERLFDAGDHLRKVMLPAEQLSLEDKFSNSGVVGNEPELVRFPIPEFDAMKALMAGGLVAPRSQFPSLVAWEHIRTLIKSPPDASATSSQTYMRMTPRVWLQEPTNYVRMYEQITLPAAKPSFFKRANDVGRPSASAEELSAQFQIPHRTNVMDKPTWGGDSNSGPILMGAWDIGKVSSRLNRPAYEVSIGKDGQITVGETDAETQRVRNGDDCDGAFMQGSAKRPLPGYTQVKQPWIFFRLATPPVLTNAKVVTKQFNLGINKVQSGGAVVISTSLRDSPTTARIDLDNDGVDDLFVWDDGGNGLEDTGYQRTRLIFVNLEGKWYLLAGDQEHACGC